MPRFKADLHDWPSLNSWLYSINISLDQIQKHFYYSALVDYFPGQSKSGHLVPTTAQIQAERHRLQKTLKDFHPNIVVTVGKLSLSYCLNQPINLLSDFIGKIYTADPYQLMGRELLIIPLPHPSGASTCHQHKDNQELLSLALKLLKSHLS